MPDQPREPRRQVVAHMSALLRKLGETPEGMQANYGVDRRHVEKFKNDNWGSTSRDELQILMSLAHQRGMQFLTLETDEIWKTFAATPAVSYLSKKEGNVRTEDLTAMRYLVNEGIKMGVAQEGTFLSTMSDKNCVLFGSPKNNGDCQDALTALFASDGAKSSPPPFRFFWRDWQHRKKESLFCGHAESDADVGLRVRIAGQQGGGDALLRAQLQGNADDRKYGWDFGLFVMCRNAAPSGDGVTTIVMCGLSGFATQEVARDLSQGLLFLHRKHVAVGRPIWRILCCPWTRKGSAIRPHSPGRRWLDPADVESVRKMSVDSEKPPPGTERKTQA